jgi:hypothetical protein
VSVTIKRDGTNPVVSTDGTATGTQDTPPWYTSAVTQQFKASDATSGLLASFTTPFTKGSGTAEGSNVSIASGAVSDNAGNTNNGINAGPFKVDLNDPTISASLIKASTGNPLAAASTGWYNLSTLAPTARYTCDDLDLDGNHTNASGVASCAPDHLFGSDASPQSDTGTVTDNAGRTNTDSVNNVKVDLSKPTSINFTGGANPGITDGATYDFGEVPAAPTGCTASDTFSGMPANGCVLTGGGTSVGSQTITATATDTAGNQETRTLSYTVRGWDLQGLYAPVDYGSIDNTVKNGSTVPLKFEVFKKDANKTELTSTSIVNQPLTAKQVACDSGTAVDEIELLATGATSLRYDTTGGQFIYNWQTPKGANQVGKCFLVGVSTKDGSSTPLAHFKLK